MFRRLVRPGSFTECYGQDNVTSIMKGPPYSCVANYLQISITSILSEIFERLVSVRLGLRVVDASNHPVCLIERSGSLRCACRIHREVHWRLGRRLG